MLRLCFPARGFSVALTGRSRMVSLTVLTDNTCDHVCEVKADSTDIIRSQRQRGADLRGAHPAGGRGQARVHVGAGDVKCASKVASECCCRPRRPPSLAGEGLEVAHHRRGARRLEGPLSVKLLSGTPLRRASGFGATLVVLIGFAKVGNPPIADPGSAEIKNSAARA